LIYALQNARIPSAAEVSDALGKFVKDDVKVRDAMLKRWVNDSIRASEPKHCEC